MNDSTDDNPTTLVVQAAFRDAWDAFYAWEQEYCRESIQNLAVQESEEDDGDEDEWEIGDSAKLTADGYYVQQYHNGGTVISWLPVEVIEVTALFPECSAYESSPLVSRSVFHGDDPDSMAFMPFADDPQFIEIPQDGDQLHHTYYKEFEWQTLDDPDSNASFNFLSMLSRSYFQNLVEIIVSAAAQNLMDLNNMSLEEIDKTDVFPLDMQEIVNLDRRRDLLPWLRTSLSLPEFGSGTREIATFCNNLNCLVALMVALAGEYSPTAVKQMPKKKNIRLSDDISGPCSTNCFLHGNPPYIETHWTPEDIEALHVMLDHAPDMTPCELTTICRKPCREIFKRRCAYIPDDLVDALPRQRPPMRSRNLKIRDTDHHAFTPYVVGLSRVSHPDGGIAIYLASMTVPVTPIPAAYVLKTALIACVTANAPVIESRVSADGLDVIVQPENVGRSLARASWRTKSVILNCATREKSEVRVRFE
ncbi:uncharacterized protein ARMOST_02023 [Armillaria ostoyae]|uniref:Uncharacterized protein n=1 Tax=Armillaria ostoyae TaxID=47428 RepID=A0A284QQJ3_ARMOS|nr:uncharacterized protein ARMOST_02023 [Armillaria ostoyae]